MTLIDISVPIRPRMPIYRGNPGVELSRAQDIGRGDKANVTRLELGAHTGTHVDAPLHFIDDGAGAEAIPAEALLGPVHVVDATSLTGDIDAAALDTLELPQGAERLIFKTRNSRLWELEEFSTDFIRFLGDGARRIVDGGVKLIGIDYLSIGDEAAHNAFLAGGVVPLEGVDLRRVEPGAYELVCTALRVVGSDGAPARAFLRTP